MNDRRAIEIRSASVLGIYLDFEYLDDHTDNNMSTHFVRRTTKILVLNPNSSASMTHGVEDAIKGMNLPQVWLQ